MLKNKVFKILLLIRNIILTLASVACFVIAIVLLVNAYIDKLNDEGLKYALGLIFGIIFLVIGIIAVIFSIFYLITSIKSLKDLNNKKYNSIMLVLEVGLMIMTISILIFQLVNIDVLVIIISSIIILQSLIIIIILLKLLKKAN